MNRLEKITVENLLAYQARILEIERLSFPSPWSVIAFEAEVKKNISHLWALIIDNVLFGYICFWMIDDEIQLVNIAVHPLKRREGHATTLLKKMFEISLSQGIKYVWLEVRPSNHAAKNLYSKFGFYEIGRRPKYYVETQEDALLMALEFEKPIGK